MAARGRQVISIQGKVELDSTVMNGSNHRDGTVVQILTQVLIAMVVAMAGFSCAMNDVSAPISLDHLSLTALSGLQQSASAGELLPDPIVVRVGLESGGGLPGRSVEIEVISGEGEVLKKFDTTDQSGIISIWWRLGMIVGEQSLRVSSKGTGELVIINAALSKPGILILLSGAGQRAYQRDTFAVPVVAALQDDAQKPIAGRVIVPKIRSGGGTVIPAFAATDSNGSASFRWIVGDEVGEQEIELLAGTPSPVRVTSSVTRGPADVDVTVFDNAMIEYSSTGQTIQSTASFPTDQYYTVQAELNLRSPCVSCGGDVDCDPWDRIGNVTIEAMGADGQTQTLALMTFITPFGNSNTYTQDLSPYSAILRGAKTVKAYISTGIGRWFVTLKLKFRKSTLNASVTASYPLFFSRYVSAGNSDTTMTLDVPENNWIQLVFRSTGHNSQGRNCDEFCQKVNEIYIDGILVKQIIPWRSDCGDFLPLNRCGTEASVRANRAGWCPGAIVRPYLIDLGRLTKGMHAFRIRIANIEPNGGYFRTSMDVSVYR